MSATPEQRALIMRRLAGRLLLGVGAGAVCGFTLRQMQEAGAGSDYRRLIAAGGVCIILGLLVLWHARMKR